MPFSRCRDPHHVSIHSRSSSQLFIAIEPFACYPLRYSNSFSRIVILFLSLVEQQTTKKYFLTTPLTSTGVLGEVLFFAAFAHGATIL